MSFQVTTKVSNLDVLQYKIEKSGLLRAKPWKLEFVQVEHANCRKPQFNA